MTTEIIALYETKSGEVALKLHKYTSPRGQVSYGWIGKFDAGCAGDYLDAVNRVKSALSRRRGVAFVSGIDVRI